MCSNDSVTVFGGELVEAKERLTDYVSLTAPQKHI